MLLRLHAFDLPLAHTFTISRESITSQPTLIVELSEGGVSGYGEATSNKYYGFTIERMAQDPEQLRGYLNLMFIARHLERVGDHATNIAEDAVYAVAAEDIRHQGPQAA